MINPPPGQEERIEILIAEDSLTQTLLLQGILERNGFHVTAKRNGRLAFETLATRVPTMVISDVQMPEMDGYELCRRIKADENLKELPVMLLTSLSAPQDIIHGLECGADNFVVKPYEEAFLIARIRLVLANRQLRMATGESRGIPINFAGERYVINSDRRQILNLLLSTYETAVKTNLQLLKTHEELKAAQAQLIEAEKLQSVGRLAAGVAHEVRNPLAILEMGLTFLDDEPISDNARMILGEMREAVRRANVVITSLMDLSSPRELGMRDASLNELIANSLAAISGELESKSIQVAAEFADNLPPCRVDASKLDQVFFNLFTNAIQAMPNGGTLTVATSVRTLGANDVTFLAGDRSGARLREGDPAVVVEVRDTGSGIAADDLGRVFEPFFSTKPTGQGMGLGLTVARKIVEAHHGSIAVRNAERGGGAVVTLALKRA